jgi:uncharacterized protein
MIVIRSSALELLHQYISNPKMIAHCLASEAVMRALARHFNENEDMWGLCGLLHDIDVELTNAVAEIHGQEARKLLAPLGLPDDIIEAIEMHNEMSAPGPRSKRIHHALAAGETITGLIFATAMVYPDKKISSVKTKSVVKRMKEKLFAASVKRENIMECEIIGISLPEFAEMAIQSLAPIEKELGF